MKHLRLAVVASGLCASALGLAAPTQAAPAGVGNAQQVISQLQSQGYNVIVNKTGTAPLDQCDVVSVRAGQTYARMDTGAPGAQNHVVTTVSDRTVYVDVR